MTLYFTLSTHNHILWRHHHVYTDDHRNANPHNQCSLSYGKNVKNRRECTWVLLYLDDFQNIFLQNLISYKKHKALNHIHIFIYNPTSYTTFLQFDFSVNQKYCYKFMFLQRLLLLHDDDARSGYFHSCYIYRTNYSNNNNIFGWIAKKFNNV